MASFLSPIGNGGTPFMTQQGVVLAGGLIYTYLAGTTTPQATWTTPAQSVQNSNPIVLNSAGLPPQEIWLQQGTAYKFVVQDSLGNTLQTLDNISGINDTSVSVSEWVASNLVSTFVSATQFTVTGNQTSVFPVGRRVQASVSAGTVYGTVKVVAFSSVTTVTVFWDSGALDSGLSNVSYGLLSSAHSSTPPNSTATAHLFVQNPNAQSVTGTPTTVSNWGTPKFDSLSNFNVSTGVFTAPTTGFYQVSAMFFLSGTFVSGNEIDLSANVNGITFATTRKIMTGSASFTDVSVNALVFANTGESINVQISQSSGSSAALQASVTPNTMSICQVA